MQKAIYKIVNLLNGKIYIGQSVHPDKRWWEHCAHARRKDDNYPIHLAINKYGAENFKMDILEWTEDYDNKEIYYIKFYNSLCPKGYNIATGGKTISLSGEDNPRNTILNVTVQQIVKELQDNILSDREIAKKYNTTNKIVADINHGYSHKQKNITYPIRIRRGRQRLTEQQMLEIKDLLRNTSLSYQEIANMYNVTKSNIAQINYGRSFKQPSEEYPIRRT